MYDLFSLPPVSFPEGFTWGSATSAPQIEGDARYSCLTAKDGEMPWTPCGMACNSYVLYKEDIQLLRTLGHQAYRFSIDWSRIEPAEGDWNTEATEHYVDLCRRLRLEGIKPFVTLYHGGHPQWLELRGGWSKLDNLAYWERFVAHLVPRIAEYVEGWFVINEFNMGFTPGDAERKYVMLKAHALGYHIVKKYSTAPVSTAHAFMHWYPRRYHDRFDNMLTDHLDWAYNEFFFHAIRTGEFVYPFHDGKVDPDVKGTADWWAVNCYTRHMADARLAKAEGARFAHKRLRVIDMDFWLEEMWPEGLVNNLERLADKPVVISENGLCTNDDRFRVAWIALHLNALREAMDRGVDVRGYFHWTLMDNWEWGSYEPRFGLCAVDRTSFERTPRPSAWFYKEIIERNGMDAALTAKYLKELPTARRYSHGS